MVHDAEPPVQRNRARGGPSVTGAVVRCPSCGAKNRVDRDKAEGARARCARCRAALEVPAPQTEPLEVDDSTFSRLVQTSPLPVLLTFWSPYCLHCQTFDPVLRTMTPEISTHMRVALLNLDQNRATAARYRVTATPTVLVLDRGRELDRMQGAQTADQLRYRLSRYMRA